MAAYKIYALIVVAVLLIQNALAKPADDSSNSVSSSKDEVTKAATPSQKLFIYTFEHLIPVGKNLVENAVNASRHMLKDESLVSRTEHDISQLKNHLTRFVAKYEKTQGHISTQDLLHIYSNATYYYNLAEEKISPETAVILNILNKYNCKEIISKFVNEFMSFKDDFVKLFEADKEHLEKALLVWYEKFITLTKFEEKFEAFDEFLKMA